MHHAQQPLRLRFRQWTARRAERRRMAQLHKNQPRRERLVQMLHQAHARHIHQHRLFSQRALWVYIFFFFFLHDRSLFILQVIWKTDLEIDATRIWYWNLIFHALLTIGDYEDLDILIDRNEGSEILNFLSQSLSEWLQRIN